MESSDALFPGLLGSAAWQALPEPVQRMHGWAAHVAARGEADVEGAHNPLARWLRKLLGLPSPGTNQALEFFIERRGSQETWTRRFAHGEMRSVLDRGTDRTQLIERLGPVTLRFVLHHDAGGIDWHLHRVSAFGLPVPRAWAGAVQSRSSAHQGRYAFAIDTQLPLVGRLVAYRGWLEITHDD
ncbi:DUF4166 domain-containing protein [Dyella monticola]|uniref:DUF4166 domain-containing protein n=1 Tax=Dyella monticola TaxID=1927958 RepID=A0A370WRP1_9GAMM|nr:DUF4166 domain-containing protein [Dyella monticola]RDS78839.1 DUF4166 domain-containing protein [Dyella monticola]